MLLLRIRPSSVRRSSVAPFQRSNFLNDSRLHTQRRLFSATGERIRTAACDLPPLAHKMREDGVLQQIRSSTFESDMKTVLRRYIGYCSTPENKHEAVVSLSLLVQHDRLIQSSCTKCLYLKSRCICGSVMRIESRHNLWLFQNVGEYGRSNNTGSLLCLVTGARRTIRGLREEQDAMMQHIDGNINSTVILFPGDNSVTLDEYMQDRNDFSPASTPDKPDKPLTLVLLDGTSRQAKNLDRFIPRYIPRVKLKQTRIRSWLDPIRKQTEQNRVCTAQGMLFLSTSLIAFYVSTFGISH